MCQHTVSFVTVKKGSNNSCKCLFRLWAGDEPDAEVYQLRKCSKGRDAKLILVEGNEPAFHNFYLSLLRVL